MSKIQFHWQSEEKYGENYAKYADARDALITKYGGEPNRREGTDTKLSYGKGSVSVGSTDNTQGRLYSHQNGATIQNRSTEYFLVATNGQLKGGISKNAIQNIVAKSGDADGVSALKKVNATDEQIKSYLEELKQLKFKVLKLMYDSILFVVASVNGEKIFFWNSYFIIYCSVSLCLCKFCKCSFICSTIIFSKFFFSICSCIALIILLVCAHLPTRFFPRRCILPKVLYFLVA